MVYNKIFIRNVCCKCLPYFANSPYSLGRGIRHINNQGIRRISNVKGPVLWPSLSGFYRRIPLPRRQAVHYKEDDGVERFLRHFCDRSEHEGSNTPLLEDGEVSDKEYQNVKGNVTVPVGNSVIDALQNQFGMTIDKAHRMVRSPKLFLIPDAVLVDTILLLSDLEISEEQMLRSPWVLFQTHKELASKIRMLTEQFLFENHLDGFGFCQFTHHGIKHYQNYFRAEWQGFPDHRNRIYYISEELKIPVSRMTEKIVKVRRLLTMDRQRVNMYIDFLKRYKIQQEDIVSDLWIFLNNIDTAERRLQAIIAAGCTRPKLWMCRASEEVFNKTLYRYQADKDALGECTSLEDYLIKRLECTREDLECILEYNDSFKKMSVARAAKTIDILFANGFTPNEVRNNLRLLRYSGKRTAQRMKYLQDLGLVSVPPSILYKSSRRFEIHCNILKKKIENSQ